MYHANKDNPDEEDTVDYDLDQFTGLMTSVVDDRLHKIRPDVKHPGASVALPLAQSPSCTQSPVPLAPTAAVQRALDLLAVAEFALVVIAIARFRQVFYSAWLWWLLLVVRGLFTVDLVYRACRFQSRTAFLKVRPRRASGPSIGDRPPLTYFSMPTTERLPQAERGDARGGPGGGRLHPLRRLRGGGTGDDACGGHARVPFAGAADGGRAGPPRLHAGRVRVRRKGASADIWNSGS